MIEKIIKNGSTLKLIEKELLDFGFNYASFGVGSVIIYNDNEKVTYQYMYFLDLNKYSHHYTVINPVRIFVSAFNDRVGVVISHKFESKNLDVADIKKETLKEMIEHYTELSMHEIKNKSTPKKKKKKVEYIYMMRNNRNGYTKIGVSNNPEYRENTLQSQEPDVELIWKKKFNNAYCKERELHEAYNEKRIRGEWFNLTDLDIEEISKV